MFLRTLIALLLMWLPLAAMGQDTSGSAGGQASPKTVEDLSREVEALRTDLRTLTATVNEQTRSAPSMEEVRTLVEELTRLREVLQEQAARGELALDSAPLSISAKMQQDEGFRQEMRKVVNDSLQDVGEVVVHNKMSTEQRIRVNQTEHVIPPGEILTVKVPVGTVTAQLPGKSLTTWTVTAPTYMQTIDIVPTESVTAAYRPDNGSTTVTTLRPLSAALPVFNATPLYTPLYVQPSYYEYYDPFLGAWIRY